MSNVIYSWFVAPPSEDEESEVLAIDSNSLIDERMAEVEKEYERQRLEAEAAARVHIVEEPLYDDEGNPVYDEDGNPVMQQYEVEEEFEDDFTDMATLLANGSVEEVGEEAPPPPEPEPEPVVLPEETIEELMEEAREQAMAAAQEEADAFLAGAQEQANAILADAESQAESIKKEAAQQGHEEGFAAGTTQAMENLELEKQKLAEEQEKLRQAYLAKEEEMEHELVQVISRVLEKVFLVDFCDNKDVVFHLIDQAMSHTEGSKQLLIRANEENGAFIKEKLSYFQERLGEDVQLDLIVDPLMGNEECMIETDGGMFDCGLDTELKNLMKKIRMLA